MIPNVSWLWLVWVPGAAVIVWRLRRRRVPWGQAVSIVVLIAYAVWIASVALTPAGPWVFSAEAAGKLSVNLVPFRTVIATLHNVPRQIVRQLGGNLLLLAPVTLLLAAFWGRLRSWKAALLVGLGVSLFIELVQLALSLAVSGPYRSVDIDDVILNIAGAALGYLAYLGGRMVWAGRRDAGAPPA